MLLFRTIKWKNLLSTGNYWTEIQLDRDQNTLIIGTNGAGKSTLLDALCFVLFGRAFRNINKPNLINSINQKECLVELTFDTNNKSYRVVRGMKPNVFQIYCNGEMINQDASARDYQSLLENLVLKMTYKSFTQIVILGSASFVPFMQLSAADRRTIIEDLLDIQIFSDMNDIVRDRLLVMKDSITELKTKIEIASKTYDLQEKHITQLRQNNIKKIKQYDMEIANNNSHIITIDADIKMLSANVESLQSSISDKPTVESKIKKITQLEAQIETNLKRIKSEIKFFHYSDNCPTCKQAIHLNFKTDQIETLSTKSVECDHGLKQLEDKFVKEQERLTTIQNTLKNIQEAQVQIATKNTTVTEINKYIHKIQDEIAVLRDTKANIEIETTKLKSMKTEHQELENLHREYIDTKTLHEAATLVLKDTGIKTKIVKQYLPIINKFVNKYLATLDFFVNFNLDETFKETIKSRHRDEFSYASFSEGEKQRIDMALMLTWRAVAKLKNSANTNLLILDEVFDSSLDTNGTEYLMNILQLLEGVNLFVISHKGDILQDKFRNVIRFDKVKNFSRIVK